jgi:hypothetical protein
LSASASSDDARAGEVHLKRGRDEHCRPDRIRGRLRGEHVRRPLVEHTVVGARDHAPRSLGRGRLGAAGELGNQSRRDAMEGRIRRPRIAVQGRHGVIQTQRHRFGRRRHGRLQITLHGVFGDGSEEGQRIGKRMQALARPPSPARVLTGAVPRQTA